jgi:uncharacterized protein involved in response to NO
MLPYSCILSLAGLARTNSFSIMELIAWLNSTSASSWIYSLYLGKITYYPLLYFSRRLNVSEEILE